MATVQHHIASNEPPRAGGQKTMERILAAAEEVFNRYGFEGARMDQIAEKAGVRKANIYYYFPSKEELYRALVTRTLGDVISEVRDFLSGPRHPEPWTQLNNFLDVLFRLADRYRGLIGLAFGELLHPPSQEHGGSAFLPLLEQVENIGKKMISDGIKSGAFRNEDPGHLLLSMEGAIFHYFLLPEARVKLHTGCDKYSSEGLRQRREHLAHLIRNILQK